VEACAGVFHEGETLGQSPSVAPIPFPQGAVMTEIVSCDRLYTDLGQAGEHVFVRVRVTADHEPRRADLLTVRAAVKVVKTGGAVGRRGRNLGQGQRLPLGIAEGREVPGGRSEFRAEPAGLGEEEALAGGPRLDLLDEILRMPHRWDHQRQ